MELALFALKFLAWVGVVAVATPTPGPMTTCDHEVIQAGRAFCAPPTHLPKFSMPDPDEHLLVRP